MDLNPLIKENNKNVVSVSTCIRIAQNKCVRVKDSSANSIVEVDMGQFSCKHRYVPVERMQSTVYLRALSITHLSKG